jgi:hypothetical protein
MLRRACPYYLHRALRTRPRHRRNSRASRHLRAVPSRHPFPHRRMARTRHSSPMQTRVHRRLARNRPRINRTRHSRSSQPLLRADQAPPRRARMDRAPMGRARILCNRRGTRMVASPRRRCTAAPAPTLHQAQGTSARRRPGRKAPSHLLPDCMRQPAQQGRCTRRHRQDQGRLASACCRQPGSTVDMHETARMRRSTPRMAETNHQQTQTPPSRTRTKGT